MVSALVKQKKRASYAGRERRFHDEQPAQNFRETANPVTLAKATTKWDDSATVQPMLWLLMRKVILLASKSGLDGPDLEVGEDIKRIVEARF